jgi:hypothetical protein
LNKLLQGIFPCLHVFSIANKNESHHIWKFLGVPAAWTSI